MTRCTHDKASNPPEGITSGGEGQSKAATGGLELYRFASVNATRLRIPVASLDSRSVLESDPPWKIVMATHLEPLDTVADDDAIGSENANLDCSQRCKV
jgi:hypothetical protein